jgi:signal transduction histidine kinase
MDTDLHIRFLKGLYQKGGTLLRGGIHFLYSLIEPISRNEDSKRHEFILNTLLLGTIVLSFLSLARIILDITELRLKYRGVSPEIIFIIFLFFLSLYALSRQGHHIISSYIFLVSLFLSATYSLYMWGIDLTQGLLIYALVIIMSGMLAGAYFSLTVTSLISFTILLFGYLQNHSLTHPNLYWKKEMLTMSDAAVIVFTLFVIYLVSWLSDREIHKSLTRAIASEAELKKERDLLEIKVMERTHALKEAQLQKTIELSRFAEFGRMTSGLFHDLLNPLTAVSLHLENLKKAKDANMCPEMNGTIDHISSGIDRIRIFSENALRQVQKQDIELNFSVAHEISATIQMLTYKARRTNVTLEFSPPPLIQTYGNPLLFYRLIMNLVSNAIDSYIDVPENTRERKVKIFLSSQHDIVSLAIQDFGCGIKKEELKKIFDPLYTTKATAQGTGLGLTICKDIVENQYRGNIRIESEEGVGTLVFIAFPLAHHKQLKHIYDEANHYSDN